MRTRFILSLICAAALAHTPAFGAEWQAGFAVANITPETPVPMAGYAARTHPSEGVVSDLHAKVLVLVDSNGQRAVWITTDLIGLRASVTGPICERIMQRTGLARRQLLFNSSHTHTGPAIAESDVASYGLSAESAARMRAYRELLQERIVSAVEQALKRLEPVELS